MRHFAITTDRQPRKLWVGAIALLNGRRSKCRRNAFTLVEMLIVLTVMGVLISIAAPSFGRSIQQSRADTAGAKLRTIWCAQRLYWLEYRTYSTSLKELISEELLDLSILTSSSDFVYAVDAADAVSFSASATRSGTTKWAGQFAIDEDGVIAGVLKAIGEDDIVPGFQ